MPRCACLVLLCTLLCASAPDPTLALQIGDLQIGPNDFRITDMGGLPGDPNFGATRGPAIAFNAQAGEYFVVWSATDDVADVSEIYGQRLRDDGSLVGGAALKLSATSQGNSDFSSYAPDVAWNPDRLEYLVVWYGREFSLGANGREILGIRLNQGGAALGSVFRISDAGDETATYNAFNPKIIYNPADQEYLAVWYADDNEGGMVDNEYEIFGQRLSALGGEIGSDFRISSMGGDGDPAAAAFEPDVAFDAVNRWYLVVWHGDDGSGVMVDNEFEIYGQLLNALGQEVGNDDFRISTMGVGGDSNYSARWPAVGFNTTQRQWLAVWEGRDSTDGQAIGESEIFGQRLTLSGTSIGADDFRISAMAGFGDPLFSAYMPEIVHDLIRETFVVTWSGLDRGTGPEVFGVLLSSDDSVVAKARRISDAGPSDDPSFSATQPAVSFNSDLDQFLAVWQGDDDEAGHVLGEFDIFGQLIAFPLFCDGFETGSASSWSSIQP